MNFLKQLSLPRGTSTKDKQPNKYKQYCAIYKLDLLLYRHTHDIKHISLAIFYFRHWYNSTFLSNLRSSVVSRNSLYYSSGGAIQTRRSVSVLNPMVYSNTKNKKLEKDIYSKSYSPLQSITINEDFDRFDDDKKENDDKRINLHELRNNVRISSQSTLLEQSPFKTTPNSYKPTATLRKISKSTGTINFQSPKTSRKSFSTPSQDFQTSENKRSLIIQRWKDAIKNIISLRRLAIFRSKSIFNQEDKTITYLKERLIDYLAVFGPDFSFNFKSKVEKWDGKDCKVIDSLLMDNNSKFPIKLFERYPRKDHSDCKFNKDWSEFAYPEGIKIRCGQYRAPTYHNAVITLSDGTQIYATFLLFEVDLTPQFENVKKNTTKTSDSLLDKFIKSLSDRNKNTLKTSYYYPMALALISHFPQFDFVKLALTRLYELSCRPRLSIPFERLVVQLVEEMPLPVPGKCFIRLFLHDPFFEMPPINFFLPSLRHPLTSTFSLKDLFSTMALENILAVFCCLLLEYRVLLSSTSFSTLSKFCQSFIQLLYPFEYNSVYIPLLPHSMLDAFMIPQPYLIGAHSSFLPEILQLDSQSDVVFVDIDHDDIRSNNPLPHLPLKEGGELWTKLNDILQLEKAKKDSIETSIDEVHSESFDFAIYQAFLVFYGKLFSRYDRYLFYIKGVPFFNSSNFINDRHPPVDALPFYDMFLSSRTWNVFLENTSAYHTFISSNSGIALENIDKLEHVKLEHIDVLPMSSTAAVLNDFVNPSITKISKFLEPFNEQFLGSPRDFSVELQRYKHTPIKLVKRANRAQDTNPLEETIFNYMLNLFSNKIPDKQLEIEDQETRSILSSILVQQNKSLSLSFAAYSKLSELIYLTLSCCSTSNDFSTASVILDTCNNFFYIYNNERRYIEEKIRNHPFWLNLHYWGSELQSSFTAHSINSSATSDINSNEEFVLSWLIAAINRMVNFYVPKVDIENFVNNSAIKYSMTSDDVLILKKLLDNLTNASENTNNIV